MPSSDLHADRLTRLAAARLYLVCPAEPPAHELPALIAAAVAGGVDIVQLREKQLQGEALLEVARAARSLCAQLGALFIVNDDPLIARAAGADGVHVGQDDTPPAEARELVGPEMLVGLSTHTPAQIERAGAAGAQAPDYIGVGPVHATPTKQGRPAVGYELVRHAAASSSGLPFFAIGGIDAGNIERVLEAGATRVCVLRAIADAPDPERAARALRARIDGG